MSTYTGFCTKIFPGWREPRLAGGQPLKLAGTGTPTGTITFFVGNTAVATVTLDATGKARLTGSFSVTGKYTIRAVYSGDSNFAGSSQSLVETVN